MKIPCMFRLAHDDITIKPRLGYILQFLYDKNDELYAIIQYGVTILQVKTYNVEILEKFPN